MGKHLAVEKKRSRLVPNVVRGEAAEYRVIAPKGKGGFSRSFVAKVTRIFRGWPAVVHAPKIGQRVIIKVPNLDLDRTVPEIRDRLARVFEEMSRSIATVKLLNGVNRVAHIFDMGTYHFKLKGNVLVAPFLVEELIEGVPFPSWLKHQFKTKNGVFRGIPEAEKYLNLAKQLAEIVSEIHRNGVIHGDIWPDNILVCDELLYLIDFGSCVFLGHVFHYPGHNRLKAHPYIAPERLSGEAEGRRSDIYSLGALFLYMATGNAPPPLETDIEKLKQQVYNFIKKHNPQLIVQNCAVADIVARCLRYEKGLRTANADKLLSEIKTFSFDFACAPIEHSMSRDFRRIIKAARGLRQSGSLGCLVKKELDRLLALIQEVAHGFVDITGEHEELISQICLYMSTLNEGDSLLIRSTPHLWKAENLGINGRVLSMIRLLVQRGVEFKHLLLICNEDYDDPNAKMVLKAHNRMLHDLYASRSAPRIEVVHLLVSSSERKKILQEGWQKGIVIMKRRSNILEFICDAHGKLRSIRILSQGPAPASAKRKFEEEKVHGKKVDGH